MRLVPYKWTEHHTHRLYHISLLTTFSFMLAIVVSGVLVSFISVRAQQTVDISATVPKISEGPTKAVGGGRSIAIEKKVPAQSGADLPNSPSVELLSDSGAGERIITLPNGQKANAEIFNSQYLKFSGHTNIPNALITIEVHSDYIVRASTYADGNGNWAWQAEVPVQPGPHQVFITSANEKYPELSAQKNFYIFIELPPGQIIQSNPSPLHLNNTLVKD